MNINYGHSVFAVGPTGKIVGKRIYLGFSGRRHWCVKSEFEEAFKHDEPFASEPYEGAIDFFFLEKKLETSIAEIVNLLKEEGVSITKEAIVKDFIKSIAGQVASEKKIEPENKPTLIIDLQRNTEGAVVSFGPQDYDVSISRKHGGVGIATKVWNEILNKDPSIPVTITRGTECLAVLDMLTRFGVKAKIQE
jgi:hypothetical protein